MDSIEEQLQKAERSVERVEAEITIASENFNKAESKRDKEIWWEEKKLLREEMKLIREEKALLRGLKRSREELEKKANRNTRQGIVKVETRALNDFWENLKSAVTEDDEAGSFLRLEEGIFFLGQPAYRSDLYVRQEYRDLSKLLDTLHTTEACVAIIGTPGIGKSMFGYWLMHKWAGEGRKIVLQKRNFMRQQWILFSSDGIFEIRGNDSLTEILADPATRYLVDGIEPMQYPGGAKMVLITLPDESIYHEFLKPGGYVRRYMDLWTPTEIELLRKTLYPTFSSEKCQARLERWGPIPRYILEKGDIAEQKCLERAIASCDLSKLKAAAGAKFTDKEICHLVVHLKVQPDSEHGEVEAVFASDFVAQSIFDQLWLAESANIVAWVSAGTNSPDLGALRGIFWEQVCHRTICRGGTFEVREASNFSSTQNLYLPPSRLMKVDEWSEASQASAETYCQARRRNMATVDSIQQPGSMFQLTASKRHSVYCAGLRSAVEAMRSKLAARLYFVVSPKQFSRFQPAAINQGIGVAELRAIEQWVIKMPY